MDIVKQKKIGILLISDDIGVVYYIVNIIKSLSYTKQEDRISLRIYYCENCEKYLNLIEYKNCEKIKIKKIKTFPNLLLSLFINKNIIINKIPGINDLDALFPINDFPGKKPNVRPLLVSWIPDFQHKIYPAYFKTLNLILRDIRFKFIIKKSDTLVLSSNSSFNYLRKFYKIPPNLNIKILPFVSMIKDHHYTCFDILKTKYSINTPYFLVSNQFYNHKNHIVVLKAIKILKQKELNFFVFFSGKTEDYRNPNFFESLLNFIRTNKIDKNLRILGLIPREDQLGLLKSSIAVIQPSKFEGWSSIIEDAKTLSCNIICSSIDVHVEQLGNNGVYFNPDSPVDLALLMENALKMQNSKNIFNDDFQYRATLFSNKFINVFGI
jgi:glycosyltransferase involved in cell wall biosynthesis